MDACFEVMLSSERRTISPEDVHLAQIVDTPEDALAVLSGV
jgi:predicted Rossmann-fold nucleotide-binding protein